jgi:hypothetical protein
VLPGKPAIAGLKVCKFEKERGQKSLNVGKRPLYTIIKSFIKM